jgi:hypothetical protein
MADKAVHLSASTRNQAMLGHLRPSIAENSDWISVVAFYKALHLIEALFNHDGVGPSANHEIREGILKRTRRYQQIYTFYRPLWEASLAARYLCVGGYEYPAFKDYMTPDQVENVVIGHYLLQLEKSVMKLLGQ